MLDLINMIWYRNAWIYHAVCLKERKEMKTHIVLKLRSLWVSLLAGILRYKVDLQQLADLEDDFNDIDLDDYM